MEFTLFGVLLVIVATVMISRTGYRWLWCILCRSYSFWHAACYCCDYYDWSCWFPLTGWNFFMHVLLYGVLLVIVAIITIGRADFR